MGQTSSGVRFYVSFHPLALMSMCVIDANVWGLGVCC